VIGLVVALVALALAAGILVLSWRAQQRTVRRVVDVVERLGETTPTRVTSQAAIDRLERSVDRVRRHDDRARLAETRLARAFDHVTQGAVICDTQGVVVARNAFALAYEEARHGEALVEAAIQELLSIARGGGRAQRQLEIHGPPRRVLFLHAAPLYDNGLLIGGIAVVDDRTEQQRVDAIRRDFVANVSHELKTPIGALSLLAETLADETDPGVARRLSGRLRDEAQRVSRTIDDLLAFSRIERNFSPDLERVAAATIVADAIERVHPVALQRHVDIHVEPVDPSIELVGDRRQLTSALFNLLENAVKYSEPDGPVAVRVEQAEGRIAMTVQDSGIGIPTRDLERIFERFYRVDKARARDTGGTGLGLSIVRHVAQNHGGDVKVSSREGEGSEFSIVLPVRTDDGPGA
jgi:two-component system sensor histidine kinase SenX3